VGAWAGSLPAGAAVLDLGCGDGVPVSRALVAAGLSVYGVEASSTLAAAFRVNFPPARVVCEPVERSAFFGRTFGGAVAWGLLFLLPAESQRTVIRNVAAALEPGGRFLFTAPAQFCTWDDRLTGLPSVSLGAATYHAVCR
jgi:SAM-dependent methyltransferase